MSSPDTPADVDEEQATPATPPTLIHRVLQIGRIVVVIAVVAAITYAMISQWDSIVRTFQLLSWKSLVGTVLAVALAMFCAVKVWQHLLESMGTTVKYGHAAQVNLVGQLGKYLPGSVWAFVLQAQLGKRFKIPRARSLVALLLAAGIGLVTALNISLIVVRSLADKWGGSLWLLALAPLTLITLLPPVLTRIVNLALKLMRRLQLDADLRGGHIFKAVLWSVASWICYGAHLWLLTGSLAKQSAWGYAVSTAAFALAMSAGFIAFIFPSGIGVREAVLVAAMAPIATTREALAIALTSRIIITLADLVSAAGATAYSQISLRRHGEHHAVTAALSEKSEEQPRNLHQT